MELLRTFHHMKLSVGKQRAENIHERALNSEIRPKNT